MSMRVRKRRSRSNVRFRHRIVFFLLRPVFRLVLWLLYGYRSERYNQDRRQPVLILANHNCNLDPFFVAASFQTPLYFVASDHIFRLGFASRAIEYLAAPIPIVKTRIDIETIRTMIETKDAGGSLCLFPEGNRSYNGVTGHIPPSTAKLLKMLAIPVVLYRIEGGYLSTPRWGAGIRKGAMKGYAVRTLGVEEVRAMSLDEINAAIEEGLYENAFERQKENPVAFRGRDIARYLERVLLLCPHCRALASMKSEGDTFSCGCGYRVRYDEYGFFAGVGGETPVFSNVYDWDVWQRKTLAELAQGDDPLLYPASGPLFSDAGESLFLCKKGRRSSLIGTGVLSLYPDRLEFSSGGQTTSFGLHEISRMSIWGTQTLQFSLLDETVYEFKSKFPRSAYKYMALYNVFEQKRRGADHGFFGI